MDYDRPPKHAHTHKRMHKHAMQTTQQYITQENNTPHEPIYADGENTMTRADIRTRGHPYRALACNNTHTTIDFRCQGAGVPLQWYTGIKSDIAHDDDSCYAKSDDDKSDGDGAKHDEHNMLPLSLFTTCCWLMITNPMWIMTAPRHFCNSVMG